ncbi:MAG TPA: hypothetical protein VKB28_09740 [Solirubrobacteraceae bacterium]|nr:hypothetical protein [Solirubrobacteraceae bacterium]
MRLTRPRPLMLPALLTASLLVAPGPAGATYRIGVGEQSPQMFESPAWQQLRMHHVRYLVPWDWQRAGGASEVDAFMTAARLRRQEVLVTFTARRGCYVNGRYSRAAACRAPSARAYRASVRAFDDRYPWVRTYSAWNEVNHISQPTFRRPRLAVRYYRALRRLRRGRGFRVMAADVLDTTDMRRYLRRFLHSAPGRPGLWGLHNYQDVNSLTSGDTLRMLRTVPGQVWVTESNGIVKFGDSRQFSYSEARAAACTSWMFRLASRFDTRRGARRSRITGVYVYRWFGEWPGARFDSGLVGPDGSPRPAYFVLRRVLQINRPGVAGFGLAPWV